MGCASSVHVSQRTGVVYCRDDENKEDPNNRRNSGLQPIHVSKRLSTASLSISEVVSHIPTSGHRESLTTEVRITHFQTGKKRDSLITTTTTTTQAWVSAEVKEAQTDLLAKGMDRVRIFFFFFMVYEI